MPSLLMPYLLNQNLPRGFMDDLLSVVVKDQPLFTEIFQPVMCGLHQTIRQCSLSNEDFKQPLIVLVELAEIKLANTRPFCNLVNTDTVSIVYI